MVTKINPTVDYSVGRSFMGKTITPINVDYLADVSGENGPTQAIEAVMKSISAVATIVAYAPLYDSDTQQSFFLEGEFPTDTYDGVNSEIFVVHLEDLVQALGTVDGFNLSSVTVTVGDLTEGFGVMFANQVDDIA